MSEGVEIIRGLSDLQKILDQFPAKVEKNIMLGALRAGARLIQKDAKQAAPVAPPSTEGKRIYRLYAGALRDSIRVSTGRKGRTVMAQVKAGGKSKKTGANVFYVHLIEYTGSEAHDIRPTNRSSLMFGNTVLKATKHPGMSATPFLRPALDKNKRSAVQAVADYIRIRLKAKHGIDTPYIDVGEE